MKNIILISAALLLGSLLIWLNAADVVVYPRSTGYPYSCPVPKTRQMNSYATGDDGDLETGIAWPATRFVELANTNCILDNLTGLIWMRLPHHFIPTNWSGAINDCNTLDFGGETDWRLPNVREMYSLADASRTDPAAADSSGLFNGVQGGSEGYWTSTSRASDPTAQAWSVRFVVGSCNVEPKTNYLYTWAVRGP